jgi:actin-related protein
MNRSQLLLLLEKLRKETYTFDEINGFTRCIDQRMLKDMLEYKTGNISEQDLFDLGHAVTKILFLLDYFQINDGAFTNEWQKR